MEFDEKEFYAVVLGALLHDIGKFVQRAQKNPIAQDHSHWGDEWYQNNLSEKLSYIFSEKEKNIIRAGIANHHGYEEYITLADAISAGMDRISLDLEEKGDPFSNRLISIFSKVSISGKSGPEKYHKLTSLGTNQLNEIFPIEQKDCTQKEYAELLNSLESELKEIDFRQLNMEELVNFLYFLLWKYCWCIPSATYKDEPDVPLFDHLKTTAAIACCLYFYKRENPNLSLNIESKTLCLIGGDISGIQSFIFDVLTQQGKVAKRLRSRSFFVQLFSEVASHKILHAFKLPLCNLILSAGGNFYILAPNLTDIAKTVEMLCREFDEWTLNNVNGELSVSLEVEKLSGKDLKDFSKSLETLKSRLSLRKYQPHRLALLNGGKWKISKFLRPEVIEGDERACQGCNKFPVKEIEFEGENLCERCNNDIRIGKLLPKANYIAFFKDQSQDFEILNYSFKLLEEVLLKDADPYLILRINRTEFRPPSLGFKYVANHVPTPSDIPSKEVKDGYPVTFNDIANVSKGDKLLGYLKVDVDNMGKILKEGFRNLKEGSPKTKLSISRFATFSRTLDTFFSGYLQFQMDTNFKEIYCIFSGGDDFFVVGPWERVIDFAKKIRTDFSNFCSNNPELTFSAGTILTKPYEPISYCTEMVNESLKKSKRKEGKNGITLFNQTVSWDELTKILDESNKIITWLKNEPHIITRGFVYNLRKYGEMAYKSKICEHSGELKTEFLRFIPLMIYDIKRNLSKKDQRVAFDWAENLIPTAENPKGGENLRLLKIIMDYVLTYTRS